LHIVSKSKKDSIKILWEPDRGITVLAEGQSTLGFINVTSYDMQPTEDISVVKESIEPSELAAIWKATSFTISDDINTYNLHGLLYDGSWVTTTGFHVSIVKTDDPEITDRLLIIPAIESFIKLISGSALNITKMEMRRHQNKHLVMVVHTDIGKMRYMISLSNYEFPNYRKFEGELLTKCPNQFTISRAEFSDVLERIGVFVDNINHFVVLDVTPEHMEVTAKSSDKGDKTVEQIAFCGPPPSISDPLHMNSNYDILRKIASENSEEVIDFRYGDMRTSLVLTLGRKEYIIAPMVEVTR
jgi:DNA polymerase III sliding clamp (beta) subunit (PCNA family)